ncbi:hypothetical protein [Anaeromusa acidaminophila]|uniref:hypothetical protein n=1 Tax=Anaeromusa acidaminophila TaxID=81464 RepID=UPI00036CE929|nr:hypothetical protein [Anaeromusa acidaminophila]
MKLKIPYSVKGKERQKLAQAVSEVLNTVARYQGVPSYAYEIGGCLLDRQGTLHIGSEVDSETVQRLLTYLAEQGFVGEAEDNADQEHSGFVVSMPKGSFTDKALNNLSRLAQSKGALFGRAFGVDVPIVFSQAKFRKKSCKNPKFTFRKSEKNRGSFLPHEGMFHAVAFPFKQ